MTELKTVKRAVESNAVKIITGEFKRVKALQNALPELEAAITYLADYWQVSKSTALHYFWQLEAGYSPAHIKRGLRASAEIKPGGKFEGMAYEEIVRLFPLPENGGAVALVGDFYRAINRNYREYILKGNYPNKEYQHYFSVEWAYMVVDEKVIMNEAATVEYLREKGYGYARSGDIRLARFIASHADFLREIFYETGVGFSPHAPTWTAGLMATPDGDDGNPFLRTDIHFAPNAEPQPAHVHVGRYKINPMLVTHRPVRQTDIQAMPVKAILADLARF